MWFLMDQFLDLIKQKRSIPFLSGEIPKHGSKISLDEQGKRYDFTFLDVHPFIFLMPGILACGKVRVARKPGPEISGLLSTEF